MEILTSLLRSNLHLGPGNDGPGQTGAEQVPALVYGVALDGGEAKLLDELAAQVGNDHLRGADGGGLGADLVPVLLLGGVLECAFISKVDYCNWECCWWREGIGMLYAPGRRRQGSRRPHSFGRGAI